MVHTPSPIPMHLWGPGVDSVGIAAGVGEGTVGPSLGSHLYWWAPSCGPSTQQTFCQRPPSSRFVTINGTPAAKYGNVTTEPGTAAA